MKKEIEAHIDRGGTVAASLEVSISGVFLIPLRI